MSVKKMINRVMPQGDYPCKNCADRHFDDDGRSCHATCERYLKIKGDTEALRKKCREENEKIFAADDVVNKGVWKTIGLKPKEK